MIPRGVFYGNTAQFPPCGLKPLRQLWHGICVAKMLDNVGCGTASCFGGKSPSLCDRCPCFGSLFPPLAALAPLQHQVQSALLAWHLPHLARRIGIFRIMRYCLIFK